MESIHEFLSSPRTEILTNISSDLHNPHIPWKPYIKNTIEMKRGKR